MIIGYFHQIIYFINHYREKYTGDSSERVCELPDHVTCTTDLLADAIRPINKKCNGIRECNRLFETSVSDQ